jgi:hypothetical protein
MSQSNLNQTCVMRARAFPIVSATSNSPSSSSTSSLSLDISTSMLFSSIFNASRSTLSSPPAALAIASFTLVKSFPADVVLGDSEGLEVVAGVCCCLVVPIDRLFHSVLSCNPFCLFALPWLPFCVSGLPQTGSGPAPCGDGCAIQRPAFSDTLPSTQHQNPSEYPVTRTENPRFRTLEPIRVPNDREPRTEDPILPVLSI